MPIEYKITDRETVVETRTGADLSELGHALERMRVSVKAYLAPKPAHKWAQYSWTVTLYKQAASRRGAPRSMRTDYHCGAAFQRDGLPIEPQAADVVHCLLSDASARDAGSFEAWADEYGYSADSREAERIYQRCLDTAERLAGFFSVSELERLRGCEH